MKGFVFFLLVGVSLAQEGINVPKIVDPHLQLQQGYKPFNKYTYKYEACVTSSFPETEKRFAGLKITCDVEFHFASEQGAFMKIKNPVLYEVNGTWFCSSDSLQVSPVSDELAPLLEQPIKFEYTNGKVGRIFCKENEPEYIVNIKRGILSILHHNFTKTDPTEYSREPRMYKNWEYGSHGMCENLFDVRYKVSPDTNRILGMEVDKTLNMKNCTGKPRFVSNVPGMRCFSKECSAVDEPLKISISSSCDMKGTEKKFAINSCKLTGIYTFAPTHLKGSGRTVVMQKLDFNEMKSEIENFPLGKTTAHRMEMTTYEELKKPLTTEERTEIATKTANMIDYLIKGFEQKRWMSWKFTGLIEVLRKADKQTLLQIWNHCYNHEKHRFWLLEALPYVYKEEVFDLITEKIQQGELEPKEAVPVLRGMALTVNPTKKMCTDISELCYRHPVQSNETLKKTCYFTAGALMYEYCKDQEQDCLLDQANNFKRDLLNADYEEKILILKSIGNFGHRTLYRPLLDILRNTTNTVEQRVTAVYALRRIAPKIPHKVLPVLIEIFQQLNTDDELRMACFVVICDCKPGPAVFNLIVKKLAYKNSNQVRSFVVSYIKGMAFSKYPCDEKMAKTARVALRMLKRFRTTLLSSKWMHFGAFSEPLQMGGAVDLQMISTPSSIVPRALTSKFNLYVLGRSLNMFETGIRGEGIQEMLQRVVGPRGHYTDKKTLFGFLRPKRSADNSYDKEVREIQDMLPVVDYKEEKAKGSFYFKVFGQELFYNYFTYDDVRELIEDGVIKVNQDLKDVFKKGMKWNLTKVFMPVEIKVYHPSCIGLPLKFTLESVLLVQFNTTIKAEVEPKFFIPLPDKVTVHGKLNISVQHSMWGKMKVYLPQLETGTKLKMTTHVTTGLSGKFQCNHKDFNSTTEFDLPKDKREIFSSEKQGYTYLMYKKPVQGMKDKRSVYRSTPLDGFEIGEVAEMFGRHYHHRYANWTLKAVDGKYLSVNEQNELILTEKPTVFKVFFVGKNRHFVKLYVDGKGFVKVKPDSRGCLETRDDRRYPKLFKVTYTKVKCRRSIRLATVVFIHEDEAKNPVEWTKTTAPFNTDQVLLFKHMIEEITPEKGYTEKWRYVSDLPLDDNPDRFHPRHMKIVYVTPEQGKVCLRPDRSNDSVLTVKRHHTNTSEVCYGESFLGYDVCMSGRYIKSSSPHPTGFPFCGPMKLNVSVKPSTNHAQKLQFKFRRSELYSDNYKTWKAGLYYTGTHPEKKIESDIKYDVTNKRFDFTADFHNMHPWLKKVCITNYVINSVEVRFFLNFGKDCEEYKIQSRITVKEPSRRELNIVTSYNQLPDTMLMMCYKLLKKFTKRYYDKLSEYRWERNEQKRFEFVVKLKTEELLDLELITPTQFLKMEDVKQKTVGFIPRGSDHLSSFTHLMAMTAPVCTVDHETFKTFDDVEFQYSLPDRCMHVLAKDCTKNNTFMVLMSKEAEKPHKKIIEIFVEKEKIRVEHMDNGRYQIQVNGKIIQLSDGKFRLKPVATIIEETEKEELHVWCDIGLEIMLVRGTKVDVRLSPYFFNRTCGICGDCNAEQYFDLKTPMGKEFTLTDKLKYGHMWMVPENTCSKAGCHLKKTYVEIHKTIYDKQYDCYPTVPVLRCFDECTATQVKLIHSPMTCVKTGSKDATKIFKDLDKRILDLTGSDVHYYEDLREETECDCSRCGL